MKSPIIWILRFSENRPNLWNCPRLKSCPRLTSCPRLKKAPILCRITAPCHSASNIFRSIKTLVVQLDDSGDFFLHHDKDESWLQNISNKMGFVAGWSSLGLNMSLRLCGGFESMPEGHFEHLWEKYSFFLDNHNLGAYFDLSKIILNYLKLQNYSLIIFDIVVNMIPKETKMRCLKWIRLIEL